MKKSDAHEVLNSSQSPAGHLGKAIQVLGDVNSWTICDDRVAQLHKSARCLGYWSTGFPQTHTSNKSSTSVSSFISTLFLPLLYFKLLVQLRISSKTMCSFSFGLYVLQQLDTGFVHVQEEILDFSYTFVTIHIYVERNSAFSSMSVLYA